MFDIGIQADDAGRYDTAVAATSLKFFAVKKGWELWCYLLT